MPTKTLLFSAYSNSGNTTSWGPANSVPSFPDGYTLGGDPAKIFAGKLIKFSGTGNTVIIDNTALGGELITARAIMGAVGTDSGGVCLCSPTGTGYQFLVNSTNIRCFSMTNFSLAAQIGSAISFAVTSGHEIAVTRNNTTGAMTFFSGPASGALTSRGVITQANANTNWRAGVFVRNSAEIASLTSEFTSAYSIDTLTDPLVPGASVSGTQTGFSDFTMEGNFGGLTVEILPDGPNFTGTMSSFVDGGLCPLLPAAAVSGTFDQGGNTASITRAITVPTGLQELRDGSNAPANFAGLVLGDSKYLGQAFVDGGNPLTTADRSYVNPAYGLKISQDGKVELNGTDHATDPVPALPYTTTLWIRRGADGRMYEHQLTINEAGGSVVVTGGGLTMTGLTMSGLAMTGLTMTGL